MLRDLAAPIRFRGDGTDSSVHVARNSLARADDGTLRAQSGPGLEVIDTGLVLQSVGYRGTAIPGVPFGDDHAIIPNRAGRQD